MSNAPLNHGVGENEEKLLELKSRIEGAFTDLELTLLVSKTNLELIAILFNCDEDKLAAGADAELVEQELKGGFDSALRDSKLHSDLLIGEALQKKTEDGPFSLGKTGSYLLGYGGGGHKVLKVLLIDQDTAQRDLMNTGLQIFRRALLVKDATDAKTNQFDGVAVGKTCSDDEYAASEAVGLQLIDKGDSGLTAKIIVEYEHIDTVMR